MPSCCPFPRALGTVGHWERKDPPGTSRGRDPVRAAAVGLPHFCTVWGEMGLLALSLIKNQCKRSPLIPTRPCGQGTREGPWAAPAKGPARCQGKVPSEGMPAGFWGD